MREQLAADWSCVEHVCERLETPSTHGFSHPATTYVVGRCAAPIYFEPLARSVIQVRRLQVANHFRSADACAGAARRRDESKESLGQLRLQRFGFCRCRSRTANRTRANRRLGNTLGV